MKSTKKWLIALMLALAIVCAYAGALAETAPLETPLADFAYSIADGEVTITKYTGSDAEIVVPATIEGLPVTVIGRESFAYNEHLTTVTLPDSVHTLQDYSFRHCTQLDAVHGAEHVLYYGDSAFEGCEKLVSISISPDVKKIGSCCFLTYGPLTASLYVSADCEIEYSSLIGSHIMAYCFSTTDKEAKLVRIYGEEKNAVIPAQFRGLPVTTIGSEVFDYRHAVEHIELPDTLRIIEEKAFFDASRLTSINLPDSLIRIGNNAFFSCKQLTEIVLPEGLQKLGEEAFAWTAITSINIPEAITKLPPYCFYGTALESLIIPKHVTAIGQAALAGTKIASIIIPKTVKEFGDYLFSGCTELTDVTLPSNMAYLPTCAFSECTSLTSLTLPDSIESFGLAIFEGCVNLEKVNIPAKLTSVPTCAFNNTGVRTNAVKRIVNKCIKPGMSDFEKALALHDWLINNADYSSKVTFFGAEGVLVYGEGVCQSYTDAYAMLLSAVGIPHNVISSQKMNHTWNLVYLDGEWYHVDCTWDDPTGGGQECHDYFGLSDKLMRKDHNWEIPDFYPAATGTRYRYGVDNKPDATPTPAPTPAPTLAPTATPAPTPTPSQGESPLAHFEYAINGGEVTITRYIGHYFSNETDVVIPAFIEGLPVTVIGEYAFSNAPIKTVTLPLSVHTIRESAFNFCTELTAVYGTQNVIRYENGAFEHCTSLRSIHISDQIVQLEYGSFLDCPLPETMLCLPADSPLYNPKDSSLYGYGESIILCFFSVENNEAALTHASHGGLNVPWHLTVPSTYRGYPVTMIAHHALWNTGFLDGRLAGLTLPSTIKVIGENAFRNSPNLKATINAGGILLWYGAFFECPGVTITQQMPPSDKHTVVTDPGLAPTCTEPGITDGTHCSDCGLILISQEIIPALGHKEVITPGIPAACTTDGLTDGRHCANCGEVFAIQEIIPATGHKVIATNTDLTLTDGDSLTLTDFVDACVHADELLFAGESSNEAKLAIVGSELCALDTGYATLQLDIRLPDGFGTNITISAFIHAQKTMTLPAMLTEIGEEAFMMAAAEEYIIPEGVTAIGPRAFADSQVKLITIPTSITSIIENAFEGCDVTFIVSSGSYAEAYAQEHSIPYVIQ